jgi:predicted nucleotidyltransferase
MFRPMARDLLTERYAERKRAATARASALRDRVPALVSRLVAQGATRVVLFGSLASGAEPHAGTDVDLCVEGLSERDAARTSLELELVAGARVDVVCWEFASAELRQMIEAYGRDVTTDRAENWPQHVAG